MDRGEIDFPIGSRRNGSLVRKPLDLTGHILVMANSKELLQLQFAKMTEDISSEANVSVLFVGNCTDSEGQIGGLREEADARFKTMTSMRHVRCVRDWNEQCFRQGCEDELFEYKVIIIRNVDELLNDEKSVYKDLLRLAEYGRAAGIILWMGSVCPKVETFSECFLKFVQTRMALYECPENLQKFMTQTDSTPSKGFRHVCFKNRFESKVENYEC